MSIERLVPAVLVVAALAVTAGGCGGSASAEEKWAGDVCSAVTTWKGQLNQVASDVQTTLQSPQVGMMESIKAGVRSAVDATTKLASDLESLTPPDTDEGKTAQQEVDALAAQLRSTVETAQQSVASVPAGAGAVETVQALTPLAPALESLAAKTSSTLTAVQAAGESLKDGFRSAEACKPYR